MNRRGWYPDSAVGDWDWCGGCWIKAGSRLLGRGQARGSDAVGIAKPMRRESCRSAVSMVARPCRTVRRNMRCGEERVVRKPHALISVLCRWRGRWTEAWERLWTGVKAGLVDYHWVSLGMFVERLERQRAALLDRGSCVPNRVGL